MVADMAADLEVRMVTPLVADMEVDKVADKIKIGQHGHWTMSIGHGQ